jgi:MerR family transcriptional regulator, copper efflux regulator
MSLLNIGQVAQKTGLGIETIRFYERKGLINEPSRKQSGYRQYAQEHILQLLFIQQAKELGFSLNEIGELLSLRSDEKSECKDIKQLAGIKLDDIDSKIKMLQRMRRSLKKLVDQCPGQGPLSDCPILDALDYKSGD